jgi:tetratricopeptide (TPR) repeat protein
VSRLVPRKANYLNTLGVAQLRAGLYAESIETLDKSLAASGGDSDADNLFAMAMARCKLGQPALARDHVERALRWRQSRPPDTRRDWVDDLNTLQAEALAALAECGKELPDDVFGAPL